MGVYSLLGGFVVKREADHDHQFQVFGVYDGDDDRFTFAVQEVDDGGQGRASGRTDGFRWVVRFGTLGK